MAVRGGKGRKRRIEDEEKYEEYKEEEYEEYEEDYEEEDFEEDFFENGEEEVYINVR